VGLATAIRLSEREQSANAARARDAQRAFVGEVLRLVPDARLTGHPDRRLPATASFVFPGTGGESVLLELERRGIVSSSGSACAAGSEDASHVLLALGYSEDVARTAVRFSWSSEITPAELTPVATAVAESVAAVRSLVG
jgi:cysteine desulfurase